MPVLDYRDPIDVNLQAIPEILKCKTDPIHMIFKKLLELGNPGMTSRWAAKVYAQIKRDQPELSDCEVIDLILRIRFNDIIPNRDQYIASIRARSTIHNITDAVAFIIDQEVGHFKATSKNIQIMNEVIVDQLCKNGVPNHMVFGNIRDTLPAPVVPESHKIDCPYCQHSLKLPVITRKTEFSCSSCKRDFNVNP